MTEHLLEDDRFIIIKAWMLNKLHLHSTSLIIYAVIYGFSKNDGEKFTGSLQYLSEWTNTDKSTVCYHLNKLLKKQYIIKEDVYLNGNKYCVYRINKKILKDLDPEAYKSVVF